MFCRSFLLSTFTIFAVIFVSNLNATKCNNFQLQKDVITQEPHDGHHDGKECVGCTGYVCKINDGKILVGSACTETVKEICQQKWDDSMIQKIAKNDGFEVVNGKYFIHSCQEDYCNTVHWLLDYLVEHDTNIASAGFPHYEHSLPEKVDLDDHWICYDNDKKVPCNEIPPFQQIGLKHKNEDGNAKSPDMKVDDSIKIFAGLSDQKLSSRHKRDLDIVCKANDKVVPCDQWEKKCFLYDKEVACNEDHKCYQNSVEYPCNGNDKHICKLNGKEIPCDGTSKTCYSNRREVSCDAPDENDVDANTKAVENGGNGVAASIKESKTPDENASIKFGNGFALIIASFFAYLFFH